MDRQSLARDVGESQQNGNKNNKSAQQNWKTPKKQRPERLKLDPYLGAPAPQPDDIQLTDWLNDSDGLSVSYMWLHPTNICCSPRSALLSNHIRREAEAAAADDVGYYGCKQYNKIYQLEL